MAHLIPLSRLARLVGQPRAALQKMAQRGELATFDGGVDLEEALRLFPDMHLDDEAEIRRVEEIKEKAVVKSSRYELPHASVLHERLKGLGRDYAAAYTLNRHYERVHGWVVGRLAEAVEAKEVTPEFAAGFLSWFKRELAVPPGDLQRWELLLARERVMQLMSAHVRLLPKGQTFEIVGDETLLEAGLRAGMSLPYGCNNGSCGDCKCKVVKGEVVKVRPHDYTLSSAEKAQGYTLACAYAAVGDVSIEVPSFGLADIPLQTIKVRIRAIEELAPGRVALHLMTPRAERLRYLAGQWLELMIGGESRQAPAASCPCEERRIEVHVPRGRGEPFDRNLAALKVNDELTIRGPYGAFVLDDVSERPVLLVSSGPGYGPIKSVLQHALSLEHAPSISLYRLAGAESLYQENLLRSYAAALDHFHYMPFAADVAQDAALDEIVRATSGLPGHDVYAAGDEAFVAAARARCLAAGLPAAQWKSVAVG